MNGTTKEVINIKDPIKLSSSSSGTANTNSSTTPTTTNYTNCDGNQNDDVIDGKGELYFFYKKVLPLFNSFPNMGKHCPEDSSCI